MANIFTFFLGYVTNVLEDARVYSEHAQKKELDISDVKLAVQTRMDHSFTSPPPRDVSGHIMEKYVSSNDFFFFFFFFFALDL